MKGSISLACVGLVAFVACSDAQRAPLIPITPYDGGDPQRPDTGVFVDAGLDASDASDGSNANDADADVFVPPAPVCLPTATWAASVVEPFSVAMEKDFSPTIAGNALSFAWLTGTTELTVHFVDRALDTDPWGAARTFVGTGLEPGEHVTMTADGLKIYGVATGGRGLVQFSRATRADVFGAGTVAGGELDTIRGVIAAYGAGEKVSDLVVSASGFALIYRKTSGIDFGLFISRRILLTDTWPAATPFGRQIELQPAATNLRRPTGLSADARALFYWDESTSTEKVAHFLFGATTASTFVDLAARRGAVPNGACARLYFYDDNDVLSAGRQP
jgi:hypothetical protein